MTQKTSLTRPERSTNMPATLAEPRANFAISLLALFEDLCTFGTSPEFYGQPAIPEDVTDPAIIIDERSGSIYLGHYSNSVETIAFGVSPDITHLGVAEALEDIRQMMVPLLEEGMSWTDIVARISEDDDSFNIDDHYDELDRIDAARFVADAGIRLSVDASEAAIEVAVDRLFDLASHMGLRPIGDLRAAVLATARAHDQHDDQSSSGQPVPNGGTRTMTDELRREIDSLAQRLDCSPELAAMLHRLDRQVKELRFNTRSSRGETLH